MQCNAPTRALDLTSPVVVFFFFFIFSLRLFTVRARLRVWATDAIR